jgi:hypothetical protein
MSDQTTRGVYIHMPMNVETVFRRRDIPYVHSYCIGSFINATEM